MYDTTLPVSDPGHLTFLSVANRVIGSSADGHTVYFTAGIPLLPGQQPLPYGSGIYAWTDGHLACVANIPGQEQPRLVEHLFGKVTRVSPSGR